MYHLQHGYQTRESETVSLVTYPKWICSFFKQSVLKKLQSHLWYLSEEIAPLFLFDNHVADETKKKNQSLKD